MKIQIEVSHDLVCAFKAHARRHYGNDDEKTMREILRGDLSTIASTMALISAGCASPTLLEERMGDILSRMNLDQG